MQGSLQGLHRGAVDLSRLLLRIKMAVLGGSNFEAPPNMREVVNLFLGFLLFYGS